MKERLVEELAAIIREELMKRGTVSIPSIGSFRVEHQRHVRKETTDGKVVIAPPVDSLVFNSDT